MPLKFFLNLFQHEKSAANKKSATDLTGLFEFLDREIRQPGHVENIIQVARHAGKKQSEDLIPAYLLLESHLCNCDMPVRYTRASLREIIRSKFEPLAE